MIRSFFKFADSKFEFYNKEWVTYRFSYAKRHNDVGVGGGGGYGEGGDITNGALKLRKMIEFQISWIAMNCQWIVYSYTKSA